ncbi:tail fiber protein [Klebsiella aerogenes]|uniref:tail fiber protein n=1 Tax=Klebsiella aerogenes TaxID=548 RepID=UPI0034D3726A
MLFMLLGNSYGGDGRTNFALPDLRKALPAVATDNDKYLRYCIAVRGDFPRRP